MSTVSSLEEGRPRPKGAVLFTGELYNYDEMKGKLSYKLIHPDEPIIASLKIKLKL